MTVLEFLKKHNAEEIADAIGKDEPYVLTDIFNYYFDELIPCEDPEFECEEKQCFNHEICRKQRALEWLTRKIE